MQDNRYPQGDDTKVCPYCAETIKAAAIVCRYCGRDLTSPGTQVANATPSKAVAEPRFDLAPQAKGPARKKGGIVSGCLNSGVVVFAFVGLIIYYVLFPAREERTRASNIPAATPTMTAVATPTMTAAELTQAAMVIPYKDLARNTENYTGQILLVSGTVIQVVEDGDQAQLRVNMYGDYDQTLFVFYPNYSKARVLDGDEVSFVGPVYGRISYEAVFGQEITLPAVTAELLEITGSSD